MQREHLYEAIDMLGLPYDAFIFDTNSFQLPVKPHWHYFIEFLYIVEGSIQLNCNNNIYRLETGDLIFVYPQTIHSIQAATDEHIKYYALKFDLNRLDLECFSIPKFSILFENARRDGSLPFILHKDNTNNSPLAECFFICIEEINQKNYAYDLLVHSAIYRILAEVIRFWKRYGFDSMINIPLDNDIHSLHSILEYIDDHAAEPLHVKDLAGMCNISYSFFARKFKELYGRSCKEYIEFVRICKAETLLLYSYSDLSSISQETGFSDCSHFIKTFKKWKGITPKQFSLHYVGKIK